MYPQVYSNNSVDVSKVNKQVFENWIKQKLEAVLPPDDDITINFLVELLWENVGCPDIESVHDQMSGFLDANTEPILEELWRLLISATASADGIPPELVEDKRRELKRRIEEEKLKKEVRERYDRDRSPDGSQERRHVVRDRSSSMGRKEERGRRMGERDSRSRYHNVHLEGERKKREGRLYGSRFDSGIENRGNYGSGKDLDRSYDKGSRRGSDSRTNRRYSREITKDRSTSRYDRSDHNTGARRDRDSSSTGSPNRSRSQYVPHQNSSLDDNTPGEKHESTTAQSSITSITTARSKRYATTESRTPSRSPSRSPK